MPEIQRDPAIGRVAVVALLTGDEMTTGFAGSVGAVVAA